MTLQQAEAFVTLVQQQLGFLPFIYGSDLLTAAGTGSPLAGCPLWIAEYASVAQPSLPPLFSAYTLWQFTDGTVPTPLTTAGINVDRDSFNGTQAELTAGWPFRG